MKRYITLVIAALALIATAQSNRSKWGNEMLEAKHQMIIEEVQLTMTQQEQFMPLYKAMEKEISDLVFQRTELFNLKQTFDPSKEKEKIRKAGNEIKAMDRKIKELSDKEGDK